MILNRAIAIPLRSMSAFAHRVLTVIIASETAPKGPYISVHCWVLSGTIMFFYYVNDVRGIIGFTGANIASSSPVPEFEAKLGPERLMNRVGGLVVPEFFARLVHPLSSAQGCVGVPAGVLVVLNHVTVL